MIHSPLSILNSLPENYLLVTFLLDKELRVENGECSHHSVLSTQTFQQVIADAQRVCHDCQCKIHRCAGAEKAAIYEKSSTWFAREGAKVIFATHFVPGARLPTYFAADCCIQNSGGSRFIFSLPAPSGRRCLSAWLGEEFIKRLYFGQQHFLLIALLVGFVLFLLIKLLLRLSTWRGRRLLLGKWRRLTRWEFWPMYAMASATRPKR